jgi:hypothetical protein
MFADITDVANDDGLHPLRMKGGDKFGGELVQHVL